METDKKDGSFEKMREDLERVTLDLEDQTRIAKDRLSQLEYLRSDFDNYRKWSEKEKGAIIALANESLIRDLLVVLDDFERALPSLEQEKNREGIFMIQKKLVKILEAYGLHPIDCVGKKTDPAFHEVLCREPSTKAPDSIISEIERGYLLKSKVIRPAKVVIAENSREDEGENYG